jgi:hypothetical protein
LGFPLVMYLSRSKTTSLWPSLEGAREPGPPFLHTKSPPTLSLSLKVDISTEWRTPELDPPLRNSDAPWPPWESESIVEAIERLLVDRGQLGSTTDFEAGHFGCLAYKLCGLFTLDDQETFGFDLRGVDLKFHGLTGRLRLADSKREVALTLALDNIAGIDQKDGRWDVWESGAMHFFREARSDGYPLIGLFTYEGQHPSCFASCGAVYFASYTVYQGLKEYLGPRRSAETEGDNEGDIIEVLERGLPAIPDLRSRRR